MRIVLPLGSIGWRGGDNYVRSLSKAFETYCRDNKNTRLVKYQVIETKTRWLSLFLPKGLLQKIRYQIYGHMGVNFPWPIVRFKSKPIFWIPDIQDIELPHLFNAQEIERRALQREEIMEKSGFFYFSSESTLKLFENHYPHARTLGVIRFTSSISMMPSSINPLLESCSVCKNSGYFYVPNQWWLHKRHDLAILAFKEYRQRGGTRHLVFSGNENDSRHPEYRDQLICMAEDLIGCFHNLGEVDEFSQKEVLTNARVILQLSDYEGWSTVVEEALRIGKPLIASNIEVHREQTIGEDGVFLLSANENKLVVDAMFLAEKYESKSAENYHHRELRFLSDIDSVISRFRLM